MDTGPRASQLGVMGKISEVTRAMARQVEDNRETLRQDRARVECPRWGRMPMLRQGRYIKCGE